MQTKTILNKNRFIRYSLFTLYALILIGVYSMCSPLFYTNTWPDANAFLTMGKGITYGLVPYRDLFEQKGPLLYFLHALNSVITPNQFWTIAVFEVIALTTSSIYIFKIAKLYCNDKIATLAVIFYPYVLLPWRVFQTGDSAEEFVIPFILISLYLIIKATKEQRAFTKKEFLYFGIFVGIALWIKYTTLGFWIGLYGCILVSTVANKDWKQLKDAFFYTSIGLLVCSAPIILYFMMNNALGDLIDVYFITNMKSYPQVTQGQFGFILNFFGKIAGIIGIFWAYIKINVSQSLLILLGIIAMFLPTNKYHTKTKQFLLTCLGTTILFAYFGGKAFSYYFLVLIPFTIFGMLAIFEWATYLLQKMNFNLKIPAAIIYIVGILCTYLLLSPLNRNIYESKIFNKNIPLQQIYGAKMNELSTHPTLLNYGDLDFGFYTGADILPTIKYFENQNIDYELYPDIMDGQNQAIRDRAIEFVLVAENLDSSVDYSLLEANYDLIAYEQSYGAGPGIRYKLYQVKR